MATSPKGKRFVLKKKHIAHVAILTAFAAVPVSSYVQYSKTPKSNQSSYESKNFFNFKKKSAKKPEQNSNSSVMPVHPTPCKPAHGFDDYRTDQTFAINPANNKEMYVNVEFKGLYKSIDGGENWKLSTNGLEAWPRTDDPAKPCYLEYYSTYIDPLNPQRVLLVGGAAPGKVSEPMYKPGGLHESLDGGKNWRQLFYGSMNAYTTYMVTDPKNSKVMYVTTAALPSSNNQAHKNVIFVKEGVVYKSVDAGKTWKELPTGFVPHTRVTGIAISSKDSEHLMISTMASPPNSGGGKILENQVGILETTDGGKTWELLDGLPEKFRALRIFAASANLNSLFVVGQYGTEEEQTFYSVDGGETFNEGPRQINFARFDPHDKTGLHLFGFSVYAQPNDFWESLDGGKTWNVVGSLPDDVDNDTRVSNLVWDPQDKDTVYLNGDIGRVWKSADKGKTWKRILDLKKIN